jgi:glycolate oxidase
MTSTTLPGGAAVAAALAAELGDGVVVTDPDILATHARDESHFSPAGAPAALVRARSTDDVAATLRAAARAGVPVVPQGARTGLSGGANAIDGCLLLSLERMDRIVEIDAGERIAVVQPGVVNADLSRAVAEQGLFYAPDPASWESSTIGGNVATNAGGLCCVKYGVTGDKVRALEVVLADGSVLRTGRRTAKGVAGYDLTHLFVGSEGTLGVITEVTVALDPAPAPALTAAATFADVADACHVVNEFMAAGARPSLLELMDGPTIKVVSAYRDLGFPEDTEALLIVSSDDPDRAAADLAAFAEVCRRHAVADLVVADDPAEAELLIEARRLVGPAHEPLGACLTDDICVPRRALAEVMRGVIAIGERHDVLVTCAGHAGDGNLHPGVVFDPADEDAAGRAQLAFEEIMALGLEVGGTITGEHGVGNLKASWLERELGPVGLAAQRRIKASFDPDGILNPGKVLAAPGA